MQLVMQPGRVFGVTFALLLAACIWPCRPHWPSGALVLILIIALSNPFRGDFRVSTLPFDQVLAQIAASSDRP